MWGDHTLFLNLYSQLFSLTSLLPSLLFLLSLLGNPTSPKLPHPCLCPLSLQK